MLGNPARLLTGVGTSVFNLFYEPAQGLVSNPSGFGKQLSSTATTFVRGTTVSVLDSAGKVIGVLSKSVKTLDMWDNRGRVRKQVPGPKPKSTHARVAGVVVVLHVLFAVLIRARFPLLPVTRVPV